MISVPEAAQVPLALLIVFGSSKVLAEVCEWLGQPAIIGEILAGILIGPSVLGWIQPNPQLHLLAELGVIFLLFRVGLEVKASELLRVGGVALLVASLGVLLPFMLGWGLLSWWGANRVESLFVGAAMVATSVGITAQVLASQGLVELRASRVILAAAVIDDVLGLLVLAVVSSIAEHQVNIAGLVTTAVLAVGFTLFVLLYGSRVLGRVVPPVEQRLRAGEVQFNLALIILFALALLAAYVGIAAIVGAFLAGMALSETVGRRVHDLAQGITELLLPFFLAGIGLQLNLQAFSNPSLLLLAGALLVAAVVSKLIGCGLGAYSLGRTDMMRVGIGMIPRGEVGMVVAQLGLGLGVVPQPIYGVVVFMAIFTTLLAPPLLRWAYREAEPGIAHEEFPLG